MSVSEGQKLMILRMGDLLRSEGMKVRKQRPVNYTPPYVTARPEVVHRKINPETGEKLRFVVIATDGCE